MGIIDIIKKEVETKDINDAIAAIVEEIEEDEYELYLLGRVLFDYHKFLTDD